MTAAWKPLSQRIGSMPLVLAGPILRRTESKSVTVWVALKKRCKVVLTVYDAATATKLLESAAVYTTTLGTYLHVVAVTAANGTALSPGRVYHYDISFTPMGATTPVSLGAALEGSDVSVGDYFFPTFSLPPARLKDLRLVHGSCRKAHGLGRGDALAALEEMLEAAADAADQRPHQLFLTGDQVYSDDVADCLLHMLIEAGQTLLGKTEVLPDVTDADSLKAGCRARTASQIAGLSTESNYGKSHLMRFGEFCAMYLFAWSEVMWPESLPSFADVYPDDDFERDDSTEQEGVGRHRRTKRTRWALQKLFEAESKQVELFRRTLKEVRRALANVPTYMIFDDHEISDDWYMSREWCDKVLGQKLGRRILTNGLLSYAIFQGWGNTPEQFAAGAVGGKLLAAATSWVANNFSATYETQIAGYVSVPARLEPTSTVTTGASYDLKPSVGKEDDPPLLDPNVVKWHYTVAGPKHQVIVLDTRTFRSFPPGNKRARCYMMNELGFSEQIGKVPPAPPGCELTMVVVPTNLISPSLTEKAAGVLGSRWLCGIYYTDRYDPWGAQGRDFETLLARLAARAPSKEGRRRVRYLLLGGDIHNSYAARLQYWGKKPFMSQTSEVEIEAIFGHFTSSPFKNQDSKTDLLQTFGYNLHNCALRVGGFPEPELWAGWYTPPGRELVTIGDVTRNVAGSHSTYKVPWTINQSPAMLSLRGIPSGGVCAIAPNWRYRVDFITGAKENRPDDESQYDEPTKGLTAREALMLVTKITSRHRRYVGTGRGTDIVGVNNIAEVVFPDWDDAKEETKAAVQRMWWHLEGAAPKPYTGYTVRMQFDGQEQDYARPKVPGEP
ncbi:MAG TPA: hypothetical protein VF297_01945 [Pyrinomonadaceae bacterium]